MYRIDLTGNIVGFILVIVAVTMTHTKVVALNVTMSAPPRIGYLKDWGGGRVSTLHVGRDSPSYLTCHYQFSGPLKHRKRESSGMFTKSQNPVLCTKPRRVFEKDSTTHRYCGWSFFFFFFIGGGIGCFGAYGRPDALGGIRKSQQKTVWPEAEFYLSWPLGHRNG